MFGYPRPVRADRPAGLKPLLNGPLEGDGFSIYWQDYTDPPRVVRSVNIEQILAQLFPANIQFYITHNITLKHTYLLAKCLNRINRIILFDFFNYIS